MNGELPKHLQEKPGRLEILRIEANSLAAFYGHPVYLCGGALRDDNPEPRDWDFRCCIPDEEFALRYGGGRDQVAKRWQAEGATGCYSEIRWRWADDMLHKSLHGMRVTMLNIDFQVYPESHWNACYANSPRVRLDTRADPNPPRVSLSGDPEE